MRKLLVIGPFPLPITGVSLGTKIVYDEFNKKNEYSVEKINTSYSKFDERIGKLSLHKVLFYLRLQLYFYKVFNKDILYITIGQTFYGVVKYGLYMLSAKISNTTLIVHIHGNYLGKNYTQLRGIKRRIFYYLMSQTDKGIVSSDSLKDNFKAFLPDSQVYSLKNFTIDELFISDLELNSKNYQSIRIVYLSNLMLEKGIFELLDALLLLENEGIAYEARIAGNIATENEGQILASLSKLKNTEYVGTVDVIEKKKLLTWSNIFILPTYYTMEAQPFAILESMATGNMVITTPHAGIPDIFRENINGLYVEKRSSKSIFDKIKYISNNLNLIHNFASHNVLEARENYRIPNFIAKLEDIFND